ncbi:potassium-transporting ATPase subunit KdpC [Nocardioides carbamazepini]|uniref:potassium-transporting ATPase subunit KdpC n=1 Tax=Nocardioides carbamazepini TaxID=2854259 RepID=UPI00214A687C|nr:potassium-transporting ATPase subunit KdpC [Nocardioides carbamazepini]MCR1781075.1 potassium-transporting ATPase subunit KdpC [Nocardioides carbamazepini]
MISSTLSDLARQSVAALRLLVVFTLILGIGYPVLVWGVGRALGDRADGQPVRVDGQVVGSALLGQSLTGVEWFHSRPSPNDYDTLASAPSNLGPLSPDLDAAVAERRTAVAETEGVAESAVPADAVTASGSGLDPHISPAYAELQAARVAEANGLSLATVRSLIDENTQGRVLGFLGEPGVNVLTLNVAILRATA